jgi:hypothetical protein
VNVLVKVDGFNNPGEKGAKRTPEIVNLYCLTGRAGGSPNELEVCGNCQGFAILTYGYILTGRRTPIDSDRIVLKFPIYCNRDSRCASGPIPPDHTPCTSGIQVIRKEIGSGWSHHLARVETSRVRAWSD